MDIKSLFSNISGFSFNLKKSGLINKHTPSENRYAAIDYFKNKIESLIKKNQEFEAKKFISILLSRFSITINNSINDSEEKEYVIKYVESLGDLAIEPVKEYIVENVFIAHAIDILKSLSGISETLTFLDSIITIDDTLFDDKLVDKRIEILKQFAGETFPSMLSKTFVFLNDSDDRLVIASIRFLRDYVFNIENDVEAEKARDIMINIFVDEETSSRIRIELLHAFIEQDWKVAGFKKKLESVLPNGYYINAQGYIRATEKAI